MANAAVVRDGWSAPALQSTLPATVRALLYKFPSLRELSLQLEAGSDEQDLELPPGVTDVADGDWVIVEFWVNDESTSVAGCVVDRGDGLRLAFEDRDWQCLWQFANTGGPVVSIPPPSAPPSSGSIQIPADTHVLVVDDDGETRQVLKTMLEAAGYTASAVGSAEEAFDQLRDVAIDLVLLDWGLPGMSGIDFTRRVRKDVRLKRLPIVFVTARFTSQDLVQAFEAGADDFVRKPFRVPELKARVLGVLRRSKMAPHHAG